MNWRCTRAGSAEAIGLAWEQVEPGKWVRWLIRRCQTCRSIEVQRLHQADLTYHICLGCFSQDAVLEVEDNGWVHLVCQICRQRIIYVDETDGGETWISHEPAA